MTFNLKDTLEIILITYNRKEYLENTLKQIFASSSPLSGLDITILDNKSNDGTSELVQKYSKRYSNIKHVINNRNIGGNANIARAFEIASKKYVWVLCDDDNYDFTHFDEVVEGMKNNVDVILASRYDIECFIEMFTKTVKMEKSSLLHQLLIQSL